jgi:hypothetical protein
MPRVNERGELIRPKPGEAGGKRAPRSYTCDIPYRAFLPKRVNNLLLAGECLSRPSPVFRSPLPPDLRRASSRLFVRVLLLVPETAMEQ